MSKGKARVFVPLIKVDEEQRLVHGRITAQEIDKAGEMMDYETSKPNFESWSAGISEASGGLSKGNLRVMHGLSVAGKLTDLQCVDEDQAIEVCAKVVDDNEWQKVLEGCYTGFSVGGSYGKKWKETVDGQTITKYTAKPNEVSLVDNPCVKSATFMLVKADGAEAAVAFKKVDDTPVEETIQKLVEAAPAQETVVEPSNDDVVAKAEEMAKAAANGTTWMDHVTAARDELMKASSPLALAADQLRENAGVEQGQATEENDNAAKETSEAETDDDATGTVEKVTPPGVKQQWTASDGKAFEKKADAVAYEEGLQKSAEEPSEADKLRARLEKALNPSDNEEQDELPLEEDFDRLGKVFNALSTPFGEDGNPKLEKGMYTINRFSNVLSDLASLSRSIKNEGAREGGDATDSAISSELIAACKTLSESFKTYVADQVEELLAGMDDDVVVTYYDYYYNAAKADNADPLCKDVCGIIDQYREPSRERRETLSKAFGMIEGDVEILDLNNLPPTLQKRFDDMQESNQALKKVAEEAVAKVEEISDRLKKVEDAPMPRVPTGNENVALRPEDAQRFFGKAVNTPQDALAAVHDMIKTEGAEGVALKLIKLAQQNPTQLTLRN